MNIDVNRFFKDKDLMNLVHLTEEEAQLFQDQEDRIYYENGFDKICGGYSKLIIYDLLIEEGETLGDLLEGQYEYGNNVDGWIQKGTFKYDRKENIWDWD